MICRKCESAGTITIRKDYSYCDSCYLIYINHKFRACIGKNKVITPNEKIVIGLSGGIGSTVLVDLIYTGLTLNNHKKLRIEPEFVHIREDDDYHKNVAQTIVEKCNNYGFNVHLLNISQYTSIDKALSCDLVTVPKTTSNDFISRMKQNVLANVAKDLKCRLIFTAEPATILAAKLLTNLVIGRGSQVENDIGFSDNRYGNIKIIRPLRDITNEELQHYVNIKSLVPACNHPTPNSLQSVINSFVNTLDKDSPATISTICKTADKIGSDGSSENKNSCAFCKGKLDDDIKKLTAIQATTFSRLVSLSDKHDAPLNHIINPDQEEINDISMFPYIHNHLCYCCSRSYTEMEGTELQKYIQTQIGK